MQTSRDTRKRGMATAGHLDDRLRGAGRPPKATGRGVIGLIIDEIATSPFLAAVDGAPAPPRDGPVVRRDADGGPRRRANGWNVRWCCAARTARRPAHGACPDPGRRPEPGQWARLERFFIYITYMSDGLHVVGGSAIGAGPPRGRSRTAGCERGLTALSQQRRGLRHRIAAGRNGQGGRRTRPPTRAPRPATRRHAVRAWRRPGRCRPRGPCRPASR